MKNYNAIQQNVVQTSQAELLTVDFKLTNFLVEAYIDVYNQERNFKDHLKMQHREYFLALIRKYMGAMIRQQKNAPGSLNRDLPKVSTNSVEMGKIMRRNPRTIRGYNDRLLKAGLLTEKVWHGTVNNYELYLNTFILVLVDKNQPQKCPKHLENSMFIPSLVGSSKRNFYPVLSGMYRHSIKKLNDKEYQNQKENGKNNGLITSFSVSGGKLYRLFTVSDLDTMIIRSFRSEWGDTSCGDTGFADAKGEKAKKSTFRQTPDLQNDCVNSTLHSGRLPQFPGDENKTAADPDPSITNSGTTSTELVMQANDQTPVEMEFPAGKPNAADASENKKYRGQKIEKINQKTMLQQLRSTSIEELRLVYAQILYNFALERIPTWKDRVYDATAGEVILYIADNYFGHCKTKNKLSTELAKFEKAVETSARYIRKRLVSKKWGTFWTMPMTYFNIDYRKGFRQQLRYLNEMNEKRKKQVLNKARLTANEKLNQILVEYFATDADNYHILLERVKKTIPHKLKQFEACVKNNIKQVSNYWTKETKTQQSKTA